MEDAGPVQECPERRARVRITPELLLLGHRLRVDLAGPSGDLRPVVPASDDVGRAVDQLPGELVVGPSIYEPFGLVAIEAMACGTPVVVADTGGLREIASGGAGLRFEPEDPEGLADALIDAPTRTRPLERP